MRPSSKAKLLEAAVEVVSRDGIAGMTLEAVAKQAGLTKAGVLYHFASKDALLQGVQRRVVDRMEQKLRDALGQPLEASTPQQRARAYAAVITSVPVRSAELAFVLQSIAYPGLIAQWDELMSEWAPHPSSPSSSAIDMFLARIAADGLWLFDSTSSVSLSAPVHAEVARRIKLLIAGGEDEGETGKVPQ